ncbi:hypothetical protein GCM10022419_015910 [Nonomuraea rosea]|uniref:ASCH domain-containing protein n=1 Tax=Nonomuraea rosea TaxID=638574 RepID=A0ABP6VNA4_9ACTN
MTGTDARTPASDEARLAVRRVGRTTMVQVSDLMCPDRLILMSAKYWRRWRTEVASGRLTPETDGEQVIIAVQDLSVSRAVQKVFTTVAAYEEFQQAASVGRFDGLQPTMPGQVHGPWTWACGTVEIADGVTRSGVA